MKRSFLSILLLLAMFSLAACGGADQTPTTGEPTKAPAASEPKTFKTDLGDLTFDKPPTKIVAINLQAIDSLVVLGVKPVGYAQPGGEPVNYLGSALDGIPTVGNHSKPSLESIAALQPELIIIDSEQQKDLVPELQKIAKVLGIRSTSYQDSMKELKLLGDIVGKRAEADKFANEFDAKVQAMLKKAEGKKGPKVAALYGAADRPGLWLEQSFVGSLFAAIKAEHAYHGPSDPKYPDLVYLQLEKIMETNPGAFFLMSTPGKELSKAWAANPAFKNTDAVKADRVHEVDRQVWSRSRGPIAASKILDEIFPLVYPEAK